MGFPMVHLCIAKEFLNLIPDIKNLPDFFAGALAPDAVHFRPGFAGDDKKKSHLVPGNEKWGEVTKNDEWKENVLNFYKTWKNSDISLNFLQGYVSHILGDIAGNIKFWTSFREKYLTTAESLANLWGSDYHKEGYEIDSRLFLTVKDDKAIWENFAKYKGVNFFGMITGEEMNKMIESIPKQYSNRPPDYSLKFRYLNPEQMIKFVREEAINIGNLLL